MSLTSDPNASRTPALADKVTIHTLQRRKDRKEPIACVTAYDYASARLADDAGLDLLLVGDSLAMVMQGLPDTLSITLDEMLLYTRAVRRATRRALLVADMPFGTYHLSAEQALTSALRFVKEAGAEAVKIEGPRAEIAARIVAAEIPVIAHLGLTPQSIHRMGGYKVQGKTLETLTQLRSDALALEAAGCSAIVLEGIPRELASLITGDLRIPTIGIGAGPDCDGQILVLHDLLTLSFAAAPKFVRRYADLTTTITEALTHYAADVRTRDFPSEAESYHLPEDVAAHLPARNSTPH